MPAPTLATLSLVQTIFWSLTAASAMAWAQAMHSGYQRRTMRIRKCASENAHLNTRAHPAYVSFVPSLPLQIITAMHEGLHKRTHTKKKHTALRNRCSSYRWHNTVHLGALLSTSRKTSQPLETRATYCASAAGCARDTAQQHATKPCSLPQQL